MLRNCFTVSRTGNPVSGIKVNYRIEEGKERNIQSLYIPLGKTAIRQSRDCRYDPNGDVGEAFPSVITLAQIQKIAPKTGVPFYVLRRMSESPRVPFLIKANLEADRTEHKRGTYTGVGGVTDVAYSQGKALFLLEEGAYAYLFFSDGHMRCISKDGDRLREEEITSVDQYKLRARCAYAKLEEMRNIESPVDLRSGVHALLRKMLACLQLSLALTGEEQKVASEQVVDNFFVKLTPAERAYVQEPLTKLLATYS